MQFTVLFWCALFAYATADVSHLSRRYLPPTRQQRVQYDLPESGNSIVPQITREIQPSNNAAPKVEQPSTDAKNEVYDPSLQQPTVGGFENNLLTPGFSAQIPQPGNPDDPRQGFPGQGFPGQGFPGQGFPGQGFPGQGFPAPGFPGQGFPVQGFPGQGFPPQGFPPQGFPDQGFPGQGFPGQGFPGQGFPGQGFPGQGLFPPGGFPGAGFLQPGFGAGPFPPANGFNFPQDGQGQVASDTIYGANGGYVYEKPQRSQNSV